MANNITYYLEIDTKGSLNSINDLESNLNKFREDIKRLPGDSNAFKIMQEKIIAADSALKNANKSIEGMDFDQIAGEAGKFAGGVGAITSAFFLMGDTENKTMKELQENLNKALGLMMAVKGGIEVATSATKLFRAENVKLMATMLANPIFLVVAAVVALGAAFLSTAKMAYDMTDELQEQLDTTEDLNPVVRASAESFIALGEVWESLRVTLGYLSKEQQQYLDQTLAQIDKRTEKENFQTDVLKARGATEEELHERNKELYEERKRRAEDEYNVLKALGTNITDEQKEEYEKRITDLKDFHKNILIAEEDLARKQKEEREKNWLEYLKEKKDRDAKELDELKKHDANIRAAKVEERDMASKTLADEEAKTFEQISEGLLARSNAAIQQRTVEMEAAEVSSQMEKDRLKADTDFALAEQQMRIQATGDMYTSFITIAKAFGSENKALQKALALAQIAVDTAMAISATVASSTANPLNSVTFGAAGAAQFAAMMIQISANIANAYTVLNKAELGGLIGGNLHANGGTIIEAEQGEAIINRKSTAAFAPILSAINQAGGGQPIGSSTGDIIDYERLAMAMKAQKVYVVSSDITNQQSIDAKVINRSKI